MRRIIFLVGLVCAAAIPAAVCAADGPPAAPSGKLFGFAAPENTFSVPELAEAYEKSGATAAFLGVEWGVCEPKDPGSGMSDYDFAAFDAQPFAKSAKTRVCWIGLTNAWADKLKSDAPERYWKLVEAFVSEFVKHANAMGIRHFVYTVKQQVPESAGGLSPTCVEPLKHIYKAVKAVSSENVVIAEQPYASGAAAIEMLYRGGAKSAFDVAAIRAGAKTSAAVDGFALVAAHREMARMGEANKPILVIGGREPSAASAEIPWEAVRAEIAEDYRNILTDRDIYDPDWVLGEVIRLPGRPSAEFIAEFPLGLPAAKLQAQLTSDAPVFTYISEKPYKLALTLTNSGAEEMKLGKFAVALRGDREMALDWKQEGDAPTTVPAGGSATANFTVTLPKESEGRQVTLVASVDYTAADKPYTADAWLTVMPAPQYEITILPARLILDPREGPKQVGMSVINHTETPFEGKIILSPYQGIVVKPTEYTTKIDPLGLEGFAFNVSADKDAAPGRYAVFVDVGGKAKDWQAVDVALVARKTSGTIAVDGRLDDWKDAAGFTLVSSGSQPRPEGKGWAAYDDSALYLALELTSKPPTAASERQEAADKLVVGFDPLIDGARSPNGGYRDDDYEFEMTSNQKGSVVMLNQAPPSKQLGAVGTVRFASASKDAGLCCEVAFPWSDISPLKPAKGTTFAIALQVRGAAFGGGLGDRVDPRMFVPVILAE